MKKIQLENVNKKYKNIQAVHNFNLEICQGDFIVIVGPSGCGKTTLLKLIAGVEKADSGKIENDNPNVSMVFQNPLLFPHMNVFDNIAMGIKNKKQYSDLYIREKVETIAAILDLTPILFQTARTLSGGQSQKVSLARALVEDNSFILMDEPCSHLDDISRLKIQEECLNIHHKLHTTIVYVTHDQKEAMKMASRLVVMNKGEIQQEGTPQQIYEQPANLFVARFFGDPAMNVFEWNHTLVGVRAENIRIDENSEITAKVISSEYLGKGYILTLEFDNQILKMMHHENLTGQTIHICFEKVHRSIFSDGD